MADWQAQVARDAQNYRDLKDRLDAAAITETDGLVTVTVSAAGLLTKLTLDEPWNPVPLADVSARIMACLARAQARIPDLVRKAMAETVGTEDGGAQVVLADARERFPEPPPEARRADVVDEVKIGTEKAVKTKRPPVSTDDWDERNLLEDV